MGCTKEGKCAKIDVFKDKPIPDPIKAKFISHICSRCEKNQEPKGG